MVKGEKALLSLDCVTLGWDQPQGRGLVELGATRGPWPPERGSYQAHSRRSEGKLRLREVK